MKDVSRSLLALVLGACLAGLACFAQSPSASRGAAVFKTNCQTCHGPNGIPNPTMERLLGVMSVTNPEMRKLTPEQMFTVVSNGKGKMPAWKGKLTDPQIRDAIAYLRTLIKKKE